MDKYLVWVIKPYNTSIAVKLAFRVVVHSLGIANSLVLSGV